MVNREISKNYLNILRKQQLLHLIWCTPYYFCLILKRFICCCFVVIYLITIIIIFIFIICFDFIVIRQTSRCHRIIVTKIRSNKLYIGIKITRSSALSTNVLFIFVMHDLTGALFLKNTFFGFV